MSPRNATESASGSRTYTWKGDAYHSVTTIINGGVPKYLVPWASKLVAEAAYDRREQWQTMGRESAVSMLKSVPGESRDAAANMGKDVHAAAEAHALGLPMPEWPEQIRPHMRGFERFLLDFEPEYDAAEATIYSRQYRYAGTGDAWLRLRRGRYAGVPAVVDYKSGRNVYSEVGLQLAAYSRGDFIGMPDGTEAPLPVAEKGFVLHIRPDDYALRSVRIDDEVFRYFRHAQQIHRWANEAGKGVLGDPETPDAIEVAA